MTTPNPACLVNGNPTPADVTVSSVVNGGLASTAGAQFWSLTCTDTDETTTVASIAATLVVNQTSKTFSFTAPGLYGAAVQFTSTVGVMGPGLDANGIKQPSFTTTFKVNVRASNGLAVLTANETFEQNSTFGWIQSINQTIRGAAVSVRWFPGVDSTGATDSYSGFVLAVAYAIAHNLTLRIPFGIYNLSQYVPIPGTLTIDADPGTQIGIIAGAWWGGTWMGESFLVVPTTISNPVGYIQSSGIWLAQVGGINGGFNFPLMYFSDTPAANLNGLTAFTIEWTANYTASPSATPFPFCGGSKTDHSPFTSAFSVTPANTGPFSLTPSLTTNHAGGTTYTAPTSTSFVVGTLYSFAATYDGTTFKFFAGPPGSAPTITSSIAATGAVQQNWWEDFIWGGATQAGGCHRPLHVSATTNGLEWGNVRISRIARTITTMRGTEFVAADRDVDTNFMMTFAPAWRSGLTGVIATAYDPARSGIVLVGPGSIHMRWRNIFNVAGENGPSPTFRNITFVGVNGIEVEDSPGVITEYCTFNCHQGITRDNNSYGWRDTKPIFQPPGYNAGNSSHSWGAAYCNVSGVGLLESPRFGSLCNGNDGLVFSFANATVIRDFFINTVSGKCGLFVNGQVTGTDTEVQNCTLGAEGAAPGNLDTHVILNNQNTFNWVGGGVRSDVAAASGYNVLIDGGNQCRFAIDLAAGAPGYVASHFGSPAGHSPALPILLDTAYQGQGTQGPFAWSDGSANVSVTPLELYGRTTWNATGAGTITCMWGALSPATGPDFSCKIIVVTDTNLQLTGPTPVIAPTAFVGHRRLVDNQTPKSIVFRASTGSGVVIAPFCQAELETNGTDWKRVTADQQSLVPTNLNGLVFWPHADTLIASPVSSWSYGAANLVQASGPSQPTWSASSANVNGPASVLFSGSQNVAATNAAPLQITGNISIFAVVYLTSAVLNTVISKGPTSEYDVYVDSTGTINLVRAGTPVASSAGAVAQNTPTIVTITQSGTTVSFFANGTAKGTATLSATVTTTSNAVQLGQRSDVGTNLHGEEPEVMVLNRAVASAEQTSTQRYLGGKYLITVP